MTSLGGPQAWSFYLQLVQVAGLAILGLFAWITRRDSVQREALGALEEKIELALQRDQDEMLQGLGDVRVAVESLREKQGSQLGDLDRRLTRVEADTSHQISREEMRLMNDRIDKVHERVSGISRSLAEMQGESKITARMVSEINEYLRDQAGQRS